MWKLSLLALLIGFNLHADKIGESNELGGDDAQDSEPYAVTPGNPVAGDDATSGAKNDPAACLSNDTIKRYEAKARKATKNIRGIAAKARAKNHSLRNVRLALQQCDLLPAKEEILGLKAEDAGPRLEEQKFVNLMNCKEWRDKIKGGGGQVPLGAVLLFSGGMYGDIRIKTPAGCIGGSPDNESCYPPAKKLTGVYVKVVN